MALQLLCFCFFYRLQAETTGPGLRPTGIKMREGGRKLERHYHSRTWHTDVSRIFAGKAVTGQHGGFVLNYGSRPIQSGGQITCRE